MSGAISLPLDRDVALVLFEWLHKRGEAEIEAAERAGTQLSEDAESIALRRLHGALERNLEEIFDSRYVEKLAAARSALTG